MSRTDEPASGAEAAETGIESVGTYVPRYRLSAEAVEEAWGQFHGAGISETAVPAADEDTLTMAYEAAARALDAGSVDPADIEGLFVGTTTPPTEEEAMGPRLVSTLGLDDGVRTRQFTGNTRTGVDALLAGAETEGPTLVVATDAPRGAPDAEHEQVGGAGAFAAILTPSGAGRLGDSAEYVEPYPGTRFRPVGSDETTGLGVTDYDRSAFVETVGQAADQLDADPADADAVALQSPNGKLPYRTAGALGVDADAIQRGTVVHEVGDAGAASPLLGLASALESGAERVLLIGYGSGGGATAVGVDGGDRVSLAPGIPADDETVQLSYGEYLRMRGEITGGEPEGGGAYVSVPSWKRTIPQRHRLVAGRCPECDALSFPPAGACTDCGSLVEYEEVELPGTGTVEAVTTIGQGGAPPEFVEQQARSGPYVSAVVALDGPAGGTTSIPAQVVRTDPADVAIGDRIEATIRRVYTQEGVTRYGFKMVPAEQ